MIAIREAAEGDVGRVKELFVRVYGEDYPFTDFYSTDWLKKSVFGDDTLFLIAEDGTDLVATGSVILTAGDLNDMVGEMGRLITTPDRRAGGAATQLIGRALEMIGGSVQFAFGEARTVHPGAQKISESFGFFPCGFQAMKYRLAHRESVVMYARLMGAAMELRRNNPRIIPEASVLAQTVLKGMGLPVDAIVEDETDGYPTAEACEIQRLEQKGVTPLLRIERGRVKGREIFGNLSLAYGFFRIAAQNSYYLVARDGDAVLGAVGFTHDPVDRKVRIFELIEFDDAVKGYLLASVDRIAREELHVEYQEVDVSAYSPRIQRTFERLGFVPVAYCPSMVFENVERLDVIRMAKLSVPYDLGRIELLDGPARVKEIVEKGLEDRLVGMEITEGTRKAEIFRGLPDGELYHLARISTMREHRAGEVLARQGERADRIYIIVDGRAEARRQGTVLGRLGEGEIFGEMGLLERTERTADVVLTADSRVVEIDVGRLVRLAEARPRLGKTVMENLARGLSEKLRRR
jgi:predicted GNAT family N-acyltransferase